MGALDWANRSLIVTKSPTKRSSDFISLLETLDLIYGPKPGVPTKPVMIVLDNVRADRLQICGYGLPTSPFLASLCEGGAACSCTAEAPSTWTLPSHASFFTGTELPQHGAPMVPSRLADVDLPWAEAVRPLSDDLPTLAERMKERGYQTVSLSGNPLITEATGLTRGFDVARSAERFVAWYGPQLEVELAEVLATELDPNRPMFLFVNICDAHQPWLRIPQKIGWLPRQERISFATDLEKGNAVRRGFMNEELPAQQESELRARLSNGYDYGVFRADQTLRQVLRLVKKGGYLEGDFRVVITSDHGEHLGEHQLLGHAGPFVFESITRVPVVAFGSGSPPTLPSPLSAIEVFDLALDGRIKDGGRPVRTAAFASEPWSRWFGPRFGRNPGAAIWRGTEKLVWQDGRYLLYDLEADPEELFPRKLGDHPGRPELEALAGAIESATEGPSASSVETQRLLQALGYLD